MKRLLRKGRWVIGAVLLLATLVLAYLGVRTIWRSAQTDDIYAAAFRYRFQHEFSDVLESDVFYISIEDKDPDARLIRYLGGGRPVVKSASQWTSPPDAGRRIGLSNLTWVGNDEATLSWGTPIGSMATWGYECRVVRTDGRWHVAGVTHTYTADLVPRRH